MQNPTVAVLIATYNGERFLEEQLDSIFSQTYTNFKIYLSDDASNDSTAEILKHYKAKHPQQLFYTINQKNIGFVKNFEKLISQCTEEYIALADQDDIWHVQKLEKEMTAIGELKKEHGDSPFLINSDLEMIDESRNTLHHSYFKFRKYKLRDTKDVGHILGPCAIMGNTLLFNQKLKNIILPFPDTLDVHDYWIGVNCELFGIRKTLFEPLVLYRIHTANSSNSTEKFEKKSFFSLLKRVDKLPNMQTNRKLFLPALLVKVSDKEDLEVLNAYIDYLKFSKNRIKIYFSLLKYSLIKRDLFFRIGLFFKIIWKRQG